MRLFVKAIQKINVRFAERREKYANGNETDIVDDVFATIVTNTEAGRRLDVISASDDVFDVQSRPGSNASRTVNLLSRECSCNLFQDLGYPCPHACSATLHVGVDIPSLCIDERMIGSLLMVYDTGIVPVDIDNVPSHVLEPPLVQRQAGRPMVNRIGPQHEDRPTRINHCSVCNERGHNKKTTRRST